MHFKSVTLCQLVKRGQIKSLTSTLSTYLTEKGFEVWNPRDGRSGV